MNGLKKYKRKVSEMLPCTAEERQYVLAEIDQSLEEGDKDLPYDALVEKLGPPAEIAAASIAGMEPRSIAHTMKTRNRFIKWVAIFVISFLLTWAVGVTAAVIDSANHSGGHSVIGTVEIVESTDAP